MPRVAVVGVGYWGNNLVRNFFGLESLNMICEAKAENRERLASEYPSVPSTGQLDEVLDNPEVDGVVIATPAESHYACVRAALLAGKDVLVEKPLCLARSEGEELIRLAKERHRVLMVGHLLWYHPAVIRLKELILQGELGRVQYIYSNRLNLGKIRREENILWSFAPHDVSVILGLLDEMPEAAQAQGGNYLHPQIADVTVSLLSFASGVKAHIFVSWLHPYKEQKLIVIGDRKMAVFNDMSPNAKLMLYPHAINWKDRIPVANKADGEVVPIDSVEPLQAECSHFLECVRTRGRPRTDGEEGLRVLTVLQQCERALASMTIAKPSPPANVTQAYFAHESAFIDDGVEIGEGTRIWHVSHILKGSRIGRNCRIGQNVVIGPNVTIGNGVKIQNNVSVYEGVTLEDAVFCGPSMVFTNVINPRSEIIRMHELMPTLVKRGATLGANCTIVCGVTIGRYAFVGAGAVVTKDVPNHALVVGNRARVVGWMCECGERLKETGERVYCAACERRYRRSDGQMQLISKEMDKDA